MCQAFGSAVRSRSPGCFFFLLLFFFLFLFPFLFLFLFLCFFIFFFSLSLTPSLPPSLPPSLSRVLLCSPGCFLSLLFLDDKMDEWMYIFFCLSRYSYTCVASYTHATCPTASSPMETLAGGRSRPLPAAVLGGEHATEYYVFLLLIAAWIYTPVQILSGQVYL